MAGLRRDRPPTLSRLRRRASLIRARFFGEAVRYRAKPFLKFAAPGHFYSPIPDLEFVERYKGVIFDRRLNAIPGIDNCEEEQLALLAKLSVYYGALPFTANTSAGRRYYYDNDHFAGGDAIVLYSMMRHYRPRRIIEIGSGFSSAVMLDTNDLFLSGQTTLTFVEPHPKRLFSLLNDEDRGRTEIITSAVQSVPVELFERLHAGDMLFIDSSHVAKVGSDVVYLVTSILPALPDGVIVHFHDVFWPFEYPEAWIREGRAWNESYLLKAFLQFNERFRILFFNSYLCIHHGEAVERQLPLAMARPGSSLWIHKVASRR